MGSEKGGDLAEIIMESDILSAYPNPTENILHVNIENSQAQEGKLLLYNTLGQVVAQKKPISLQMEKEVKHLTLAKWRLVFIHLFLKEKIFKKYKKW